MDIAGYEEAKVNAQVRSQSGPGGSGTTVDLDVHAIAELREKGLDVTNDISKYYYSANKEGAYGELGTVLQIMFKPVPHRGKKSQSICFHQAFGPLTVSDYILSSGEENCGFSLYHLFTKTRCNGNELTAHGFRFRGIT